MIKEKFYEIGHNFKTEYAVIKRQRRSPLGYYIYILALVLALFAIGNAYSDNLSKVKDTQKKLDNQTQDNIKIQRDNSTTVKKLQDQLNIQQKQLNTQDEEIKKLQVKKAEQLRLASIKPVARPRVPVWGVSGNCETFRPLVSKYSWDANIALLVMQKESGCRVEATHLNTNGTVDHGLFQLNNIPVHNPVENIAIAFQKYAARGNWSAWYAVCTPTKVAKYPGVKCV